MRILALALAAALPVWLAAPSADALCTTGVECIRERFGSGTIVRNNRIIDGTDRLGNRRTAVSPYLAGQNAAEQARRAGRFDSTTGATARGTRGAAAALGSPVAPSVGALGPSVRYAPGTAYDPYAARAPLPDAVPPDAEAASDLTVAPYEPALPATGPASGRAGGAAGAAARYRPGAAPGQGRPAAPAEPDRNMPQGAADLRYGGPRTSGAYR